MLRFDISAPLGYLGTHQDRVIREMLGLNTLGLLDVNTAQTEVTWAPFFSSGFSLTGLGDGLASCGITLTAGHLDGFSLADDGLAGPSADVSNFNHDAAWLQARIDATNAARLAKGETFDWAVENLNNRIFANRAQKIIGSDGNDVIEGGHKDDIIRGGDGDDTIFATEGNDHVYAGPGYDQMDFSKLSKYGGVVGDLAAHSMTIGASPAGPASLGDLVATSLALTAGSQFIAGIELLQLTSNADGFAGDSRDNVMFGGGGGTGMDSFIYSAIDNDGNDTILDFEPGEVMHLFNENSANVTIFPGADTIIVYSGGSVVLHGISDTLIMKTQASDGVDIAFI